RPDTQALSAGVPDHRGEGTASGAEEGPVAHRNGLRFRASEPLYQPLQTGDWFDPDALAQGRAGSAITSTTTAPPQSPGDCNPGAFLFATFKIADTESMRRTLHIQCGQMVLRIASVSFLNARPLIEGLE